MDITMTDIVTSTATMLMTSTETMTSTQTVTNTALAGCLQKCGNQWPMWGTGTAPPMATQTMPSYYTTTPSYGGNYGGSYGGGYGGGSGGCDSGSC